MIELRRTGEGEVALLLDGKRAGGAAWEPAVLRWDGEAARVARLTRLEAGSGDRDALWAYLEFLWRPQGVAAAELPDGALIWFHAALERSWRASGAPRSFSKDEGRDG